MHAIRGPYFGPVSGPGHPTWGEAVRASLEDITSDAETAGMDTADLRKVLGAITQFSAVLDEITEPRMLAGDLWTVNLMLDASAETPVITGVLDLDRTGWGDPAADWTIRMAAAKPGTERDAFWQSYGPPDRSDAGRLRARIY